MTQTFSQAVQATLASVREQCARCGSNHPSTSLLRRHASKHIGSDLPSLVAPVIAAVRDELGSRCGTLTDVDGVWRDIG